MSHEWLNGYEWLEGEWLYGPLCCRLDMPHPTCMGDLWHVGSAWEKLGCLPVTPFLSSGPVTWL